MHKAAALIAGLAAIFVGLPAAARPYLMLDADDRGFEALDLGGMDRSQEGRVQASLIEAPLAGAPAGDTLAPLVQRRIEVDCAQPRWRVLSTAYLDGQEKTLGQGEADGAWTPFGEDPAAPTVQAAACRREYRLQSVSRYLNLGEILANYQAAHAKAAPEPETEKDLLARRFRNSH